MTKNEIKQQHEPKFNDDGFTRAFILVSDEYKRWRKARIVIPGVNAPAKVSKRITRRPIEPRDPNDEYGPGVWAKVTKEFGG